MAKSTKRAAKRSSPKKKVAKRGASAAPELVFSRPALGAVVAAGPDGVVVATRAGGELLDLATGATLASLPGVPAARTDGALVVAIGSELVALDAATRARRGPLADVAVDWLLGAPELRADGDDLLVHAGGSTFALWDLSGKRPARRWSVKLTPAFAPAGRSARHHVGGLFLDGDLAVVARRQGPTYGLDRTTGEERWRLDAWALALDGRGLLARDADGRLAAFDRRGRHRWTSTFDDVDEVHLAAGLVAAQRLQTTQLLDRATGAVQGRARKGTPEAFAGDLLLVADEGLLHAVGADGRTRWTYDLAAGMSLEPPVYVRRLLALDGRAVGQLEDGAVFALAW